MKNTILILLVSIVALVGVGCRTCSQIVKDKSGVEAAVYDMERIYKRVETIGIADRMNTNKPPLMKDTDLMITYGDAASFLNGYWKNVVGDLSTRAPVKRSRKAYLEEPAHAHLDKFFQLSEEKLKARSVRESVSAALIAGEVLKVIEFFLKRCDELDGGAEASFKAYLTSLNVVPWGEKFDMPKQPDFVKKAK